MRFLKYLLIIIVTVCLTLGCVYGFSCVSCDSCEGREECYKEEASASALSEVTYFVEISTEEISPDDAEDEDVAEVPQWFKITFDVVVIVLSVGVIVLIWFLFRKFMKSGGKQSRRFG